MGSKIANFETTQFMDGPLGEIPTINQQLNGRLFACIRYLSEFCIRKFANSQYLPTFRLVFLQSKRHSDGFLLPYHYNNNGPVWAAQQANARGLKMGSMPFEVTLLFAYFYTYIRFHEMFSRILFMNRSKLSF